MLYGTGKKWCMVGVYGIWHGCMAYGMGGRSTRNPPAAATAADGQPPRSFVRLTAVTQKKRASSSDFHFSTDRPPHAASCILCFGKFVFVYVFFRFLFVCVCVLRFSFFFSGLCSPPPRYRSCHFLLFFAGLLTCLFGGQVLLRDGKRWGLHSRVESLAFLGTSFRTVMQEPSGTTDVELGKKVIDR